MLLSLTQPCIHPLSHFSPNSQIESNVNSRRCQVNGLSIARASVKSEAGMFIFHISFTGVWFVAKEQEIKAGYKSYLEKCYETM